MFRLKRGPLSCCLIKDPRFFWGGRAKSQRSEDQCDATKDRDWERPEAIPAALGDMAGC